MAERDGSTGGRDEPPPRHSKVRRHSHRLHGLWIAGVLALMAWAYARLFICWGGHDTCPKSVWCNSHTALYLILPAGFVVFCFLIIELAELGHALWPEEDLSCYAAPWRGYRSLEGWERFHPTFAVFMFAALAFVSFWILVVLRFEGRVLF